MALLTDCPGGVEHLFTSGRDSDLVGIPSPALPGDPPAALVVSGRLGSYRLLRVIGSGGSGVVHLALDPSGRAVAVKVLSGDVSTDPVWRSRLAREVDVLRRVRSPFVAEVLDADPDSTPPFLVTEFVPALSLEEHVRVHGPLSLPALARLGVDLADALSGIHAAGVVHRDLKPGNVLLHEGRPVVVDFGISQLLDDVRLTRAGLVVGTPGHLPPEVLAGGPVGPSTDWWGWAACLAHAATGRPPFGTGPLEVVLARVHHGRVDLDGAPEGLVPLLRAALSPDPLLRPSPEELRTAAAGLSEGPGIPAPSPVPAPPLPGAATTVLPVSPVTRTLPAPATRTFPPSPAPAAPPAPVDVSTPTRRDLVALSAATFLVTFSAVAPLMAVVLVAVGGFVARTISRNRVWRDRPARPGGAFEGPLGTFVHLPLDALLSGVRTVFSVVLPFLFATGVALLLGWAAELSGRPTGTLLPLLVAGMVFVALSWSSGGEHLREGVRAVLVVSTSSRFVTIGVVVTLLLLAGSFVCVALVGNGIPDWSPLSGSLRDSVSGLCSSAGLC